MTREPAAARPKFPPGYGISRNPEGMLPAYEAKYDYRPGGEGDWFALRPRVAYAWREGDFPRSATRFSFWFRHKPSSSLKGV